MAQSLFVPGGVAAAASIPGYYNFSGSNLSKWQTALSARAAGTRNVKLAAVGDSTTAGAGAGTGVVGHGNAIPHSWPNQLAGLLSNASASSMWASHNYEPEFDSRLALTGGWGTTGGTSVGGSMWNSTTAGTLSFTPTNPVDTFVFYYPQISGGGLGTLNVNIDGGTNTLIDEGTATGMASRTFTTTLGNHTLNMIWASGEAYVAHVVAYNSAAKEISIYNMGAGSSLVSNWLNANSPYNEFSLLPTLTPDLTIYGLTINDMQAGTGLSTYTAGLQSLITNVQSTGDVILMSGNPIDPVASGVSLTTQQGYVDAMKSVALSTGVPMIDTFFLFGSNWTTPSANGWVFTDGIHPNTLGYTQIAGYVNRALASGFRST